MSNSQTQCCSSNMDIDGGFTAVPVEPSYCTRGNQLTAADLLTLADCKEHANAVLKIVDDLERTGNSDQELLKFPKTELLDILGRSKPKEVLRGAKLHEYLKTKMVVITKRVYIPLPLDMPSGTDIKKYYPI